MRRDERKAIKELRKIPIDDRLAMLAATLTETNNHAAAATVAEARRLLKRLGYRKRKAVT